MSSASTQPIYTNIQTEATTTPKTAGRPARRVREVRARALTDFESSRELVFVMRDAVLAHKRLYEDAHILHGDINPNTIVIFEDPPPPEDAAPAGQGQAEGEQKVRAKGGLVDFDPPLDM